MPEARGRLGYGAEPSATRVPTKRKPRRQYLDSLTRLLQKALSSKKGVVLLPTAA
jgi:hypothetical protein